MGVGGGQYYKNFLTRNQPKIQKFSRKKRKPNSGCFFQLFDKTKTTKILNNFYRKQKVSVIRNQLRLSTISPGNRNRGCFLNLFDKKITKNFNYSPENGIRIFFLNKKPSFLQFFPEMGIVIAGVS